jgi:phage antirepressor YoqD-like protein
MNEIQKNDVCLHPEVIEEILSDPDTIIEMANTWKKDRAARLIAEAKIKELKPKAEYADKVLESKNTIYVGDYAKILSKKGFNIGEIRLFQYLRNADILDKNNLPHQKYIDRGYFEVTQTPEKKNGAIVSFTTTRVTTKGQLYIFNKLKRDKLIS